MKKWISQYWENPIIYRLKTSRIFKSQFLAERIQTKMNKKNNKKKKKKNKAKTITTTGEILKLFFVTMLIFLFLYFQVNFVLFYFMEFNERTFF